MKKLTVLLISLFLLGSMFLVPGVYQTPQVHADFPDVPTTHPHYDAIMWLQSEGHIAGYPDGRFGPEDPITRAAFLKILMMASGRIDQEKLDFWVEMSSGKYYSIGCFPDVQPTDWFTPFVCQAFSDISGYPDGTFKPGQNINFAEGSKMVARIFRFKPETGESGYGFKVIWPEDEVWFRPYVNVLAYARAIPTDITDFGQLINRGQLAEMAYRVENKILDKDFTTYNEIAGEVVVDDETFPGFRALFQVLDESDIISDDCNLAEKIGPLRLEKYFDILIDGYPKRLVSSPNREFITKFEFSLRLLCKESGLEVSGKGIVLNSRYISGVWKNDEITLGIDTDFKYRAPGNYDKLPGECTITYSIPGPRFCSSDACDDVYNEFLVTNYCKCEEYGFMKDVCDFPY